jgi:hypothetical protein
MKQKEGRKIEISSCALHEVGDVQDLVRVELAGGGG